MGKMTTREIARANHISHTKLYDTARIRRIAESRGLWGEIQSRIMAGEKQGKVLAELMPDVAEQKKVKQQINQYRSTTRWLLENGFQADDLIDFICEEIDRPDLAEHLSIYLQK